VALLADSTVLNGHLIGRRRVGARPRHLAEVYRAFSILLRTKSRDEPQRDWLKATENRLLLCRSSRSAIASELPSKVPVDEAIDGGAIGNLDQMLRWEEDEGPHWDPFSVFFLRFGRVADAPELGPLGIDPSRGGPLAHAQAGMLVGAQEAPELEVIVAR